MACISNLVSDWKEEGPLWKVWRPAFYIFTLVCKLVLLRGLCPEWTYDHVTVVLRNFAPPP